MSDVRELEDLADLIDNLRKIIDRIAVGLSSVFVQRGQAKPIDERLDEADRLIELARVILSPSLSCGLGQLRVAVERVEEQRVRVAVRHDARAKVQVVRV